MSKWSLSNTLARLHRIKRWIDEERRRGSNDRLRLLRLQGLLLKAQRRLAELMALPHIVLAPVRVQRPVA